MSWHEPRYSIGRGEEEIGMPGLWRMYDHQGRRFLSVTDVVREMNLLDKLSSLMLARGCELSIRAPIGESFQMVLKWTEFIPPGMRVPITVKGKTLEECLHLLAVERSELELKYRQGKKPVEVLIDEADSPQAGEADPQEAEGAEVESEQGGGGVVPGGVPRVPTQGDLYSPRGAQRRDRSSSSVEDQG